MHQSSERGRCSSCAAFAGDPMQLPRSCNLACLYLDLIRIRKVNPTKSTLLKGVCGHRTQRAHRCSGCIFRLFTMARPIWCEWTSARSRCSRSTRASSRLGEKRSLTYTSNQTLHCTLLPVSAAHMRRNVHHNVARFSPTCTHSFSSAGLDYAMAGSVLWI